MLMKLVFLLLLLTLTISAQVDSINLLLPQLAQTAYELPKQLLSTKGGCYHWTSSSPEILAVTPHDPTSSGCSFQALVEVAQPGPFPSSVYVTAVDAATQSILNIPARIRKINQIFIATKSRMMNIREMQKLQLYAHDSEDNTFTSLEGLRFTWTLEQVLPIIETVPISQAKLLLPLRTRENIEKKGFQSDVLVVRALTPGNLKIIARCIEPGYEHLSNEITLSVHQRFELKPGPVLMMAPSSKFQLNLVRPSQEVIVLPQAHYNIISCPGFTVNSTLFLTVPEQPSQCQIKVQDIRTKPPYFSVVTVIVQHPDQIKIVSESILIVGKESSFDVKIYYKQKLMYGEPSSLNIISTFQLDQHKKTLLAQEKKFGSVKASLGQLQASKDITAYLPVAAIVPGGYLHLPLDQVFKLRVVGGSGLYDYIVASQIAHISNMGVITCKQVGDTDITIIDRSHPANKVVVRLKVSAISIINSLESQKEVNIQEWGYIYILGTSSQGEHYTQCLASHFNYGVTSTKLQIEKKVNFYAAIRDLATNPSKLVKQSISATSLLKGKQKQIVDRFRIYVNYNQIGGKQLEDYIAGLQNYGICEAIKFRSLVPLEQISQIALQSTEVSRQIPLRVYQHLTTTIKEDQISFLMTPESSLQWLHQGGSYPWSSSQTTLTINGKPVTDQNQVIIHCPSQQTSSTQYDIVLSNLQTKSLLFPCTQKTSIFITCQYPKKLQLSLQDGDLYQDLLIAPNTEVRGQVEPFDDQGQSYYNSSNLVYNFASQSGTIKGSNNTFKYNSKGQVDLVRIFTQKLNSNLGFKKVELTFKTSVAQPLTFVHPLYNQSQNLVLNRTKLIKNVVIFNPNKHYVFTLSKDSPGIVFKCSGAIDCSKQDRSITMKMLRIGRGEVVIRDKKVYGSTQWTFVFIIVQPEDLTIQVDRPFVQQGQRVKFVVYSIFQGMIISPKLYEDNHLHLLLPSQLKLIKQQGNIFTVQTQAEGFYSVNAQQDYPRSIRSRNPASLNVYQKINVDMNNVVETKEKEVNIIEGQAMLVAGCKKILRIKGGPSDMKVALQSDRGITAIQKGSRVYEISGNSKGSYRLTFRISNVQELIAVLKVRIQVNSIKSVQLVSITEPIVGSQFRLLPRFRIGEVTVQNCICDFEYKWSVANGLIRLGSSVTFGFLTGGGVNATALAAGRQLVTLQVRHKENSQQIVSTTKNFQITSGCSQNLPSVIGGPVIYSKSMLIPPLSGYQYPPEHQLVAFGDLLRVGYEKRQIQTGRKVGEGTLKIIKRDCLTEIIAIQIVDIAGALIQNSHGFISLAPGQEVALPFYLIDKHGRVFVSPLTKIQFSVTSSNPEVVSAKLAANGKDILVKALRDGTCLLVFSVIGQNIIDQISVSVGSQIRPAFQLQVLKGALVTYSVPNSNQIASWSIQNPRIASINAKTGQLTALQTGRTKVSNNQVIGWLIVKDLNRIQQVGQVNYSLGVAQITFRGIWSSSQGEEQISHFTSTGQVNNNLQLKCSIPDNKGFQIITSVVYSEGKQRLVCKIMKKSNVIQSTKATTLQLQDKSGTNLATFTYQLDFGFTMDPPRRNIQLNRNDAKTKFVVTSSKKVRVLMKGGDVAWLSENYIQSQGKQQISIDMSGVGQNVDWQIVLQLDSQRQLINVRYNSGDNRPYWSLELDWPDYLILLMIVVFLVTCALQYLDGKKSKYD